MREFRYQATDATIEALRLLKAPWQAATLHERTLVIRTQDAVVQLSVERDEVDTLLEVHRLRADVVPASDPDAPLPAGEHGTAIKGSEGRAISVPHLAVGRNDVVVFTGETWVEGEPPGADTGARSNGAAAPPMIQFSGRAGQRPPTASVVCTTTDSVVFAAATGEGILITIGARPMSLEIVQDRTAIARFLVLRGYAGE